MHFTALLSKSVPVLNERNGYICVFWCALILSPATSTHTYTPADRHTHTIPPYRISSVVALLKCLPRTKNANTYSGVIDSIMHHWLEESGARERERERERREREYTYGLGSCSIIGISMLSHTEYHNQNVSRLPSVVGHWLCALCMHSHRVSVRVYPVKDFQRILRCYLPFSWYVKHRHGK